MGTQQQSSLPGVSGPDPGVIDEFVRRIVAVAHPERIIVFGSAARGQMGPDSDIDVIVVKTGVPHRRRLAQEIYMSLGGLGVAMDVIVATTEDVEHLQDRVGSVIAPA